MRGLLGGGRGGWQAVGLSPGRVDIAQVLRTSSGMPRLVRLESYARGDDDAKTLAALRKKGAIIGREACTTLMAVGDYVMAQMEAPRVPDPELASAVRWSLKDMLDYPVDTATVDVARIPVEQSLGRPPQLFAIAASNVVLAPLIQAFDAAKLNLQVVDIPEMAQRNIAALLEEDNRGLAMLTFDANGGLLTFTFQGELYFARRVEITSEQLATPDLDRRGVLFDRIGLELQRSLDSFERMYSFISVSKVVLGPGSFVADLEIFLRDYGYVPVQALDLTSVIDCAGVPEIRQPDLQAERLMIIGAALRDADQGSS